MLSDKRIAVRVVAVDALDYEVDVLALKYAQGLYGLDRVAFERLSVDHPPPTLPQVGEFTLLENTHASSIAARKVLFVGVQPLGQFGYAEIREFGRLVLGSLERESPETRHVAFTIHGPGYGLDEVEAFGSELAGAIEAINSGAFPKDLETLSFVEKDRGRAKRLSVALERLVPKGWIATGRRDSLDSLDGEAQKTLRSAGYASNTKPHVFVAMSFASEMDDLYHYGIQGAVNAVGMLCERADLSSFTGDVVEWVTRRISTAKLVVADLSTANPNVYLEVGYAWGCNVPTLLIVREPEELKFNVRGQRCIIYKSIRQLEEKLAHELSVLVPSATRRPNR